jgi:phosphate starvation-inducible protein PhoH and related proteins
LQEKIFTLPKADILNLLGAHNSYLKLIQAHFSKLKIIHRGDELMVKGADEEILEFEAKLNLMLQHLERYNYLTENNLLNILSKGSEVLKSDKGDEILVYGNKGLNISARTLNQRKMVEAINQNDMLFAIGPAGTGKTYTAVALAVRALKNKEVRRIVLTRPAVEAGENLGFLPGDMKEKLDPYLQPLYDALRDMIPHEKLNEYIENRTVEIAPLAFMRGRTLDHAFVILDEGQNATDRQMKMFLTRMGKSAKFIITGDISQVDLPKREVSGLKKAVEQLSNIDGISFVFLDEKDVVRHRLVKIIIEKYN